MKFQGNTPQSIAMTDKVKQKSVAKIIIETETQKLVPYKRSKRALVAYILTF